MSVTMTCSIVARTETVPASRPSCSWLQEMVVGGRSSRSEASHNRVAMIWAITESVASGRCAPCCSRHGRAPAVSATRSLSSSDKAQAGKVRPQNGSSLQRFSRVCVGPPPWKSDQQAGYQSTAEENCGIETAGTRAASGFGSSSWGVSKIVSLTGSGCSTGSGATCAAAFLLR